MRVVKEIAHPDYRITIFNWNNKYLLKMETAMFEQTYKIDQYELASDEEVVKLLDDEFLTQIVSRFEQMSTDFRSALDRMQS